MMADQSTVQVVGAGSWGLALARLLANNGHAVRVWCRVEDEPDRLRETRESPIFLPGVRIPESVEIGTDVDSNVDIAVLAVPSHVMRSVLKSIEFSPSTIRVNVAKGIENDTLMLMDEVIRDVHGDCFAVTLSGPSHAEEVGRDLPTLICAAGRDHDSCVEVQHAFAGPAFRVYTSPDVVGVELGGSLKNVIAIAAGVCDGFGFGDNARAALMTRGLAEISRLGTVMGADPLTFMGLTGMGDLIATCSSRHSRNRAVGMRLAQGMTTEEAVAASPMVAEGVRTAQSAWTLAQRHGVEMPITHQVYRVLFEGADARQAVMELMLRELKPEVS